MANGDDLQGPQVTPIGQPDAPPPEPSYSPAPRAELVNAPRPDDSGGDDKGQGATQADLIQHVYDLTRRAEEDVNKARSAHGAMEEEIRSLYQQEQQVAQTPAPQMEAYPEAPNTERRSVALAHMMMAIPGALFGGTTKYNPGGALHGLSGVWNEFKNSGSRRQIAERIALYREQVNITHQQNEDILKQYHDIMADKRADIHTKLEAIKTLADVYKDKQTSDTAALDDWDKMVSVLDKAQKMQDDTVKNVYGTMDEFNKAFGNSTEDKLYRSWGAENYPDLREGLFSDDKRTKGNAVKALEKRKSFYTWQKENWKWMHPSETAGEKEEELKGQTPPPDKPTDDMRKAIQDMHPDLLFGTPKPGEKQKEDRRSKSEKYGYDPRHPFNKPQPTSDE